MSRKFKRMALITLMFGLIFPLGSAQRMGGGGGGMGCGCGSTGGAIIDPPIGSSFMDLPQAVNLSATPGVVEVDLDVRRAPININGATANLMTYNGLFPGPVIRIRRGDILSVKLTNSLPRTTQTNMLGHVINRINLHTHGFHVSPEGQSDNVMYEVEPGGTYYHVYDSSMQPGGVLNFYHTHKHGLSAEQYWAGLCGPLVIEDETDVLAPYETHIMILKDITINGAEPAAHATMMDYMHGKEGQIIMVNGQVNPRLTLKAGQVQRWRILNASNARFYRLALDSHVMHLIGTDGGLLDKPYAVSELLLSPGERVDVLVKASQSSGNYRLRALPYSRMGNMGGETITLLTTTYSGQLKQSLPASVNPAAARVSMDTSQLPHRTLTLSMGQGNGYINGMDYDVQPFTIMSTVGAWEVWTIVNESGMDHPFHQHVNPAQVLAISGGDANYKNLYTTRPAWKDTVLIPKWGSATLLIPVMDFSGMAMFHCHILEHEDIGMMGMWHIMEPMGDGM